MARLLTVLLVGLLCEAIGVVFLSRGLKEIVSFFSTGDIRDLSSLASKLSVHDDPVSELIWQGLSQEEQKELTDPAFPPQRKKAIVVHALNSRLGQRLYDPERFANVRLSEPTRALLGQAPQGNERVRLNRLLVQDAYPAELAQDDSAGVSVSQVLHLVGRGVTNAHVILGVFFEALFFVALLMLMSKADVSFVWPLTSLSFVVTTIAAKIYLHEHVSALRWSGVCLIMLGAGLITWTEKHKTPGPAPAPVLQSPGGTLAP
jgi:hypothetical protein